MKKIPSLLIIVLFLLSASLHSQSLEQQVTDVLIEGIETIALTVINSAFTPMTGYEKGDILFTCSPGLFNIRQVYGSPEVTGEDLWGFTLGAGAGYALSDRTLVYGIGSALIVDGTMEAQFFGSSNGDIQSDTNFQYYSLFAGMGYEVVQGRYLSLPVYAGVNGGVYSLQASPDEITVSTPVSASMSVETEGRGVLAGVSGGAAVDLHYKGFSLVPYYLYMFNFNGTELDSTVSLDTGLPFSSPADQTIEHKIDAYRNGMLGISTGYKSNAGWGFSLSLKNIIPLFEKDRDDDYEITSFIFAATYSK